MTIVEIMNGLDVLVAKHGIEKLEPLIRGVKRRHYVKEADAMSDRALGVVVNALEIIKDVRPLSDDDALRLKVLKIEQTARAFVPRMPNVEARGPMTFAEFVSGAPDKGEV